MNVYGMGADSILLCLYLDREFSNGNAKNCPKSVQDF